MKSVTATHLPPECRGLRGLRLHGNRSGNRKLPAFLALNGGRGERLSSRGERLWDWELQEEQASTEAQPPPDGADAADGTQRVGCEGHRPSSIILNATAEDAAGGGH